MQSRSDKFQAAKIFFFFSSLIKLTLPQVFIDKALIKKGFNALFSLKRPLVSPFHTSTSNKCIVNAWVSIFQLSMSMQPDIYFSEYQMQVNIKLLKKFHVAEARRKSNPGSNSSPEHLRMRTELRTLSKVSYLHQNRYIGVSTEEMSQCQRLLRVWMLIWVPQGSRPKPSPL